MTHPLLHLLVNQPGLVADHAAGYAEMLSEELGVASVSWRKRILLCALGLCCAMVALMLAGVALMLWAVGLMAQGSQSWILIATPLVPAAGAWCCWMGWRVQARAASFNNIKSQMKADFSILRQECMS